MAISLGWRLSYPYWGVLISSLFPTSQWPPPRVGGDADPTRSSSHQVI